MYVIGQPTARVMTCIMSSFSMGRELLESIAEFFNANYKVSDFIL